ncbi:MAG: LON peptidase substrate-binding domain-containing protein [Acidimicrobiales bacterium]
MGPLPMFPLGMVLVPSAALPLHVFEPRYRALVRDCLAGNGEFGVVLIERGHEVGGGDVRSSIGTVARIVEAAELGDGRWAIGAVGVRRIRVGTWLPDDPYPQAQVEAWPDPDVAPDHEALLERTVATLRRSLALAAEAGETTAPATIELADDPVLAGYQAAAVAPIGSLDRQRLLAAVTPEERLHVLGAMLRDAIEVLQLRLGEG